MIPPAFPGTENSCPFLFLCADVFFSLYRYLIFLYTDTCFLYVDSCFLYVDSSFKPSRQVIRGLYFVFSSGHAASLSFASFTS